MTKAIFWRVSTNSPPLTRQRRMRGSSCLKQYSSWHSAIYKNFDALNLISVTAWKCIPYNALLSLWRTDWGHIEQDLEKTEDAREHDCSQKIKTLNWKFFWYSWVTTVFLWAILWCQNICLSDCRHAKLFYLSQYSHRRLSTSVLTIRLRLCGSSFSISLRPSENRIQ